MNDFPLLRDLGEDEIVRRLIARLHVDPAQVPLGPGDDCAVLTGGLLFKTDALVENVHFTWDMGAARIGRKAVNRVLSDFAAMGGAPLALLVTAGAPGTLPYAELAAVYDGINAAAREAGCSIAGGELTAIAGPAWFSIAGVGTLGGGQGARRSEGRPGDILYVTGRLGGSFTSGRHLDFTPRLAEGRWLAENYPVRAMMDLSDGLGADLPRLARSSGTGYRLDRDALPLHEGCTPTQALNDGEDYELLLAVPPEAADALDAAWAERFPGLELTRIGQLTDPAPATDAGPHEPGGYHHFRGA
jgi:thiamine-monophosphate kinase